MSEQEQEVEQVSRVRPELAEFSKFLQSALHNWQGERLDKPFIQRNQSAFSAWLGLPKESVSEHLNGIKKPSPVIADKYAARLGVKVYDLLGYSRRMPKDKRLLFIVDSYPNLSERYQKELLEVVKNLLEDTQRDKNNLAGKPK